MPAVTEKQIQMALWGRWEKIADVCLPNFWIFDWESDWIVLTKSGYLTEVEIKTSRSDLLADRRKKLGRTAPGRLKVLEHGSGKYRNGRKWSFSRPNRFYYAVPASGLAEGWDELMPAWAGILRYRNGRVREKRKPKRLHNEKASPQQLRRLMRSACYRFMKQWCCRYGPAACR